MLVLHRDLPCCVRTPFERCSADARRLYCRPEHVHRCARTDRGAPSGITLIELTISLTITSFLTVILGALVMAVQTAWQYTSGLEEATMQANASLERMRYMVAQAGVYQTGGQPTTVGLAVVHHVWSGKSLPDVLVVWSGGRDGGMAATGLQNRLPLVSELVIYTWDSDAPHHLVELTFPTDSTEIDFASDSFPTAISNLLTTTSRKKLLLVDRLRRSQLSQSGASAAVFVGNVRFGLALTPTPNSLSGVTAGSAEWNALMWAQGIVTSEFGMRQATVRMELQIEGRKQSADFVAETTALPFFGSVSYRYAYRP